MKRSTVTQNAYKQKKRGREMMIERTRKNMQQQKRTARMRTEEFWSETKRSSKPGTDVEEELFGLEGKGKNGNVTRERKRDRTCNKSGTPVRGH